VVGRIGLGFLKEFGARFNERSAQSVMTSTSIEWLSGCVRAVRHRVSLRPHATSSAWVKRMEMELLAPSLSLGSWMGLKQFDIWDARDYRKEEKNPCVVDH